MNKLLWVLNYDRKLTEKRSGLVFILNNMMVWNNLIVKWINPFWSRRLFWRRWISRPKPNNFFASKNISIRSDEIGGLSILLIRDSQKNFSAKLITCINSILINAIFANHQKSFSCWKCGLSKFNISSSQSSQIDKVSRFWFFRIKWICEEFWLLPWQSSWVWHEQSAACSCTILALGSKWRSHSIVCCCGSNDDVPSDVKRNVRILNSIDSPNKVCSTFSLFKIWIKWNFHSQIIGLRWE